MNVVYLNTFEKKHEEKLIATAQVSIAEYEGAWVVMWNEKVEESQPIEDIWYQGLKWDELVLSYRLQSKSKISEGYTPFIPEDLYTAEQYPSKSKQVKMLDFYTTIHANPLIYEELRVWRREQAISESKAPYMIATNQMLRMISVFLPHTLDELREIPGYGRHKTNQYADDILNITGKVLRKTEFPLDWVILNINLAQFEQWITEQKDQKLKLEQEKQQNKRKLLELVTLRESIDVIQSTLSISRRDVLLWIEELDREGYDVIALADKELSAVPNELQEKAWQLFQSQGAKYLKPVLEKLIAQEGIQIQELDRFYDWLRLLRIKFLRNQTATQEGKS